MSGANAALWYEALASEHGIIVSTDDPAFLRQKLYSLRKELKDPDLEGIAIMQSPTNPKEELWLVKKGHPGETQGTVQTPEGDVEPS